MPLFWEESRPSVHLPYRAYAYLLTAGSRGGASVSHRCHKIRVHTRVDCPCHCSSVEEIAKPEPGPGEIVVKIEASGLCHTDIHAAHGDWPVKPKLPFIPGYEGVGIVEMVGPGVTEVKERDRVAIPWLGYACGICEYCVSGWETLCGRQLNTGYFLERAYAEYANSDGQKP